MQVKIIISLNILALYLLTHPFVSNSQPKPTHEYQLTIEFSPIRIYYDELLSILGPARNIVQRANHGYENDYVDETLTVSDGVASFSWKGTFPDLEAISRLSVGHSVNYYYYNRGAPIKTVDIQFRSAFREIKISGSSQEQIDALSAMLEKAFKQHTIFFSSFTLFFVSYVIFWAGAFYFFYKVMDINYSNIFSSIISAAGAIFIYNFIPRFVVLTRDSTFLSSNSALFTFLGFMLAFVAVGEILIRLFRSHFKITEPNQ